MPLRLLGTTASSVQKITSSYESIASVTATGGETQLTFSSIPSSYVALQIRGLYRDGSTTSPQAAPFYIKCNSDGATYYAYHNLKTTSSGTITAAGLATQPWIQIPFAGVCAYNTSGMFGVSIVDIQNYASTTQYKTIRAFAGGDTNASSAGNGLSLASGLWMNTAALNRLDIFAGNTDFSAGSTFALYGIKGA